MEATGKSNVMASKRVLLGGDLHGADVDERVWGLFCAFKKDFRPHRVIAGGDWGNFNWASAKYADEEGVEAKEEYAQIEKRVEDAGVTDYLAGNHEARVKRIGGGVKKQLRSLLGVQKNLNLTKRGIKFFPYHKKKGVLSLGKLKVLHGFWCNQYAARSHADAYGCCVHFHTHRFQTFTPKKAFESHTGFNIGCMCRLDLPYKEEDGPDGWMQGFAFAYIHKNGHFNLYDVRVVGNVFVINGKEYRI